MDNNIQEESPKVGPDLSFPAYIIGGSILLGAIIITGGMLYLARGMQPLISSSGVNSQPAQAQAGTPSAQAPAQAPAAQPAAAGTPVKITLKPNTPFLGNASAKVTVVEYADYECPFCEQFFKTVWPELKAKYVDTGKIKYMYQDFAFLGPDSNTAAEASHCAADQNKFWQYHDYLFTNQGAEGSGWATAAHQKQFAAAVGLNTTQFNTCLDSGKYKQEVLDETAAGKSFGVSGTPTLFVNGVAIVGAQPVANFEQAIDAALK
ncbi:MAG: DsbA family protein [Candidatus Doudnabacteria bacterium]|nr:DsbA family protein [Candidatus Doudnabacteria bacterium]